MPYQKSHMVKDLKQELEQDFLAGGEGDSQIYRTIYTPTTYSQTTVEFFEPLLCHTIF